MIKERNIVCCASGWNYHPTSKHHVMRRLAERNHVIWVNWHASRRPSISFEDLKSIGSKLWQIRSGAQPAAENMTVITPPQIPLPGSKLARRINAHFVRAAVDKVLAGLPRRPVQLWSFAPDMGDLVGSFDEELMLYYCVDAFGEFPGYDRALIERRERELMAKSDVVLATSVPLYEAKKPLHPNVHLVQHGVNHDHLARAVRDNPEVPADLRALPGPILGFVGVVGEWVDLDLLAGLAKRRPDASVVIIGPCVTSKAPLEGLPNVHWLGPRDHSQLPNYLRGFDVGLIPFRQVPLTHHANPIKLYEYLAAGVPVVSTPLPAVKPIMNAVWLADNAEQTATGCTEACKQNDAAARQYRSQLMAAESWTARLDQIGRIVSETLRPQASRAQAIPAKSARMETALAASVA